MEREHHHHRRHHSYTQQEMRHREILQSLYRNQAYWSRCGGPENRPGLTFMNLLSVLQEEFPASMWDEFLLDNLLTSGLRTGLYKSLATPTMAADNDERHGGFFYCPTNCYNAAATIPLSTRNVENEEANHYFANDAMIIQRPTNIIYQDIAPRRICKPKCNRIIAPIV